MFELSWHNFQRGNEALSMLRVQVKVFGAKINQLKGHVYVTHKLSVSHLQLKKFKSTLVRNSQVAYT